jgi:hypothetical protein
MANPASQSLDDVVDITITVGSVAAARATFNQGLILGSSTVIPSVAGTNPRVRKYTSLSAMLTDGFTTSSPEYIAAEVYFAQNPAPNAVYIGRQDLTTGHLLAVAVNAGGEDYVVGDVLALAGGTGGAFTVGTVDSNGAVISGTITNQGTGGYSVATGVATSGSATGSGCTLNVTAVTPESCVQAMTACRNANLDWYGCMAINAAKADHIALALYVEAASPDSRYFYATSDADVPAGTTGNVMLSLKGASYSRSFGVYATTQNATYPNQIYMRRP